MTHLSRAAPIHRFGISAPRHPGTPATHSRCRGAVFVLRHNVRDNGTMPVMNDEVPGEGDFDAGRRRGEFDDITSGGF
ncbi:hypothetical protein CJD48_02885 [Bifidobacterium bifidum]|nr:hypothetical protein CJD48_02885 [Bifidobacterium bifidum]